MKFEQIDLEKWDIAKILADNFTINGEGFDESDFEWSAFQLQEAGYHKQEWISVNEALPDEEVRVLVKIEQHKDSYTEFDTDRVLNGKWVRWNGHITYWMPLPEAPKGERE